MQQEGILGDGSLCMFNVYEALLIWDGQVRSVEINESEAAPLVGMGLLEGYELKIQGVAGGSVTITALSSAHLNYPASDNVLARCSD
jgi:predicted aspartyl protease